MKDANKVTGFEGYFASRLRELMKNGEVTQQDLAKAVGTTRQAISQYADGSVQPNIEKLFKMADYFNVSADYLLGIADIKSAKIEDKAIAEKLGLSDKTIENLKDLHTSEEALLEADEAVDIYCSRWFLELFNFLIEDYNCYELFLGIIKYCNVSLKIYQAEKLKKHLKKVVKDSMPDPDLKMFFDGISFDDSDNVNFTVTPEEAKFAILGKISEDLRKLVEKFSEFKIKEFTDELLSIGKEIKKEKPEETE